MKYHIALYIVHLLLALFKNPFLYLLLLPIYIFVNKRCYMVSFHKNFTLVLKFILTYVTTFFTFFTTMYMFNHNNPILASSFHSKLAKLLFYIILYLFISFIYLHKTYAIRHHYKKYIYLVYVLKIVIFSFIIIGYVQYKHLGQTLDNVIIFIISFNLITLILTTYIYEKLLIMVDEKTNEQLNNKINQLNHTYYEEIHSNLASLISLKHDFKNHLSILSNSIENENYLQAKNYINSLYHHITENIDKDLIISNNPIVSSILQLKKAECQQQGIIITIHISFQEILHVSDVDLLIVLSNILDNAIEAATLSKTKRINFSIIQSKSYLVIKCINSYTQKPIIKNGLLYTTKTNHKDHGIGLMNMKK